jgi:hypothetical protein
MGLGCPLFLPFDLIPFYRPFFNVLQRNFIFPVQTLKFDNLRDERNQSSGRVRFG